jgi:hypothetical protein
MLFTTTEIAQILEAADMIHLTRQIEACAPLFPDNKSHTHPVGNGIASFTLPSLGKKLNRIIGLGMFGPVTREDLSAIEKMYAEIGLPTQIDLCPHADPSALEALEGYNVNGWINRYVRVLADEDIVEGELLGVEIAQVIPEKFDEFMRVSYEGFKSNGRSRELLDTLAKIAVGRVDTRLYFAMVGGQIAGSAALALIETSRGRVAHVYLDSTLHEFRGRGIHVSIYI